MHRPYPAELRIAKPLLCGSCVPLYARIFPVEAYGRGGEAKLKRSEECQWLVVQPGPPVVQSGPGVQTVQLSENRGILFYDPFVVVRHGPPQRCCGEVPEPKEPDFRLQNHRGTPKMHGRR